MDLQSITGVWERSSADEQTEREGAVNFNWGVMRGVWRRISAGSRRWIDESIRLRGQAETVYFCDDGDGKWPPTSNDRRLF
ncbi:hypothetical protein AWB69_02341 [Caballeronia udeis]|uniref:Uncharacterized protein n=1 Tax=Caballeronia udeis TaxID=1232866 RepID=A0A158GC79_9BURK|nr:hypothetical protein AWB69_02341 [Caballeronia udeis]